MFQLRKKIQQVAIRLWNNSVFKKNSKSKVDIEEQLKLANDKIINNGINDFYYSLQKNLQSQQEEILKREEIFWRQKSREL